MAELLEEQRESWGTRGTFVLAAIGSAVGLGNLWRFPYEVYDHGGGAFMIPYIIAVFAVGVPMLILEFSLGHFSQRAAPDAFASTHRRLEVVGWWSIFLGFLVASFYTVIMAYCLSFLWFSIVGVFQGGQLPWAGEGIEGVKSAEKFFLETYLGRIPAPRLGSIRWNILLPVVITWLSMYLCIFKGVKVVGKIVSVTVPLPWVMLLILAVRGLTLAGNGEGLAYYLNPDWSELARASTWRFAFGQAFFSLSLAFGGVMITYASFLHRKSDLNNNAAITALSDFATSFVAGLAVFATLGGMAFVTRQAGHPVAVENVAEGGPSLAFIAFPYALAQLPYSAWFSVVFFVALITLGIDSAFSITESLVAAIVEKTGWRRCVVLPVVHVVGVGSSVVYITQGGLNWLGVVSNFIDGTWGIVLLGLLECIVLGWLWRVDILRRHANERSDWKIGKWWEYLIRIFIPIVLGSLFFWSFFDDLTQEGGFLRDRDGNWIPTNCVGLAVILSVPVAAVLVSLAKGRSDVHRQQRGLAPLRVAGRAGGALALILALASGLLVVCLFRLALSGESHRLLLLAALPLAVVAIVIGNYLLNKHNGSNSRASWLARWAGLIAVMDVSGSLALSVIYSTRLEETAEVTLAPETGYMQLNGTSYVILAAVSSLIICGLGWCFYRALGAAGRDTGIQHAGEVGDEQQTPNNA
jgi:NSS family neurotransmitter:Na+ symporter